MSAWKATTSLMSDLVGQMLSSFSLAFWCLLAGCLMLALSAHDVGCQTIWQECRLPGEVPQSTAKRIIWSLVFDALAYPQPALCLQIVGTVWMVRRSSTVSWQQPSNVCQVLSRMACFLRPPRLCSWPVHLHSRNCCVMVPRAWTAIAQLMFWSYCNALLTMACLQ